MKIKQHEFWDILGHFGTFWLKMSRMDLVWNKDIMTSDTDQVSKLDLCEIKGSRVEQKNS